MDICFEENYSFCDRGEPAPLSSTAKIRSRIRGKDPQSAMPQRKGRILEIMRLQERRMQIESLRMVMLVVAHGSPDLALAMTAMLDCLACECDARLEEMREWWNPQILPASPGRSAESFTDDELRSSFRFDRGAVRELLGLLAIPDTLRSASGRRFGGEEAFLLLLRRLGGRERGWELAKVFGRSPPAISEMYNVVLDHVYAHTGPAMRLELWENDLLSFAEVLREGGCPEPNCVGFIDGTMFTICRPGIGQESMYNGWKRQHKVKYQCVVLPNFLIGDWFGPAPGRAHDSHVLAQSDLVLRLRTMRDRLGTPIYVYGDPAYPISDVILRAPKGTNLTPAMEEYASRMSHYRETVEWVFGKMGELWPFVTDVRRKTTGSRATSKEDCVAALLTNYHTCRYGGVANSYLKTTPPTMRAYRSMYTID